MNQEEIIRERIKKILAKRQELEYIVSDIQDEFFNQILINYDFVIQSQKNYSQFFGTFNKDFFAPALKVVAEDLKEVVELNKTYFLKEFQLSGIETVVKEVETTLLTELGINSLGGILPDGYISDLVKDTSIKREFRANLFKLGSKRLTKEQTDFLELYIKGNKETMGMFENFFSKNERGGGNVFDNYQRADRIAQKSFSDKLKIQAWIYTGGLIESSRDFCEQRNGKVFLESEIKAWKDISFQGKPKSGYEPFTDCGGYRCRHVLSGISNATAMRLDSTIKLVNNKLTRNESL